MFEDFRIEVVAASKKKLHGYRQVVKARFPFTGQEIERPQPHGVLLGAYNHSLADRQGAKDGVNLPDISAIERMMIGKRTGFYLSREGFNLCYQLARIGYAGDKQYVMLADTVQRARRSSLLRKQRFYGQVLYFREIKPLVGH
jgi:hypothetical protein